MVGRLRTIPRDAYRTGAFWALGYLAATGILTVLIPNGVFIRMTPIAWVDYLLWPISALLIGAFMALRQAGQAQGAACSATAGTGGLAAFLGFSCPVCNKILILLMGTGGVLTFIEPYRTWIGLAGIALLAVALAVMWRGYRDSGAPPVPKDATQAA